MDLARVLPFGLAVRESGPALLAHHALVDRRSGARVPLALEVDRHAHEGCRGLAEARRQAPPHAAPDEHRRRDRGRDGTPPAPQRAHHPLRVRDRHRADGLALLEPFEVLEEGTRGRVPLRRVLLERLQAHRLEVGRHLGIELPGTDGIPVKDGVQHLDRGETLEGRLPHEALVQDRPDRVDVGRLADRLRVAARLLRAHVGGGSDDLPDARQTRVGGAIAGEAEVHHVRRAALVQEDVAGLQITVDEPRAVRVADGARDLPQHAHGAARRDAPRADLVRQRAALDEVHREEDGAVHLADLVHRDDVGMAQPRQRLRLLLEPPQELTEHEVAGAQHLHGDDAPQALLPRPVDDPHAAATELAEDLVVVRQPRRRERRLLGLRGARPREQGRRRDHARHVVGQDPVTGRERPRVEGLAAREDRAHLLRETPEGLAAVRGRGTGRAARAHGRCAREVAARSASPRRAVARPIERRTAVGLRPTRLAISSSVRSWKKRRRTTSRSSTGSAAISVSSRRDDAARSMAVAAPVRDARTPSMTFESATGSAGGLRFSAPKWST